jgi:hypothetical protein
VDKFAALLLGIALCHITELKVDESKRAAKDVETWNESTDPRELLETVLGYGRATLRESVVSMWTPRLNRLFAVALLRTTNRRSRMTKRQLAGITALKLPLILDTAELVADHPVEFSRLEAYYKDINFTISSSEWNIIDLLNHAFVAGTIDWLMGGGASGDRSPMWGGDVGRLHAGQISKTVLQPLYFIVEYQARETPHRQPSWILENTCYLLQDFLYGPEIPQVNPEWLTEDVVSLANACYESHAVKYPESMPGRMDPAAVSVLADALEEAGCPSDPPARILSQLRAGKHWKGCWCVDLLRTR